MQAVKDDFEFSHALKKCEFFVSADRCSPAIGLDVPSEAPSEVPSNSPCKVISLVTPAEVCNEHAISMLDG